MHKGMFTQSMVILLSEAVDLDAVRECVSGTFKVGNEVAQSTHWEFGGPSLVVAYKPEVNGYVSIDVVDQKWPDHMGDPETTTTLMAAWTMGHFGPFAYSLGLRRATEQSYRWRYDEAAPAVARHTAFLRIRASYVFGAAGNAPTLPAAYDPLDELYFMSGIAQHLLKLGQAICYFNPNGELLLSEERLGATLDFNRERAIPAVDAWCNVRMFTFNEHWLVMDTVGNLQLDMLDHEAAFPKARFSTDDVSNFLRDLSLFVLKNGAVIKDGDPIGGAGRGVAMLHLRARDYRSAARGYPLDSCQRRRYSGDFAEECGQWLR